MTPVPAKAKLSARDPRPAEPQLGRQLSPSGWSTPDKAGIGSPLAEAHPLGVRCQEEKWQVRRQTRVPVVLISHIRSTHEFREDKAGWTLRPNPYYPRKRRGHFPWPRR